MTKYVRSNLFKEVTYRINDKGLVTRIYDDPSGAYYFKHPKGKVLEIVPFFRGKDAIGVYTPQEIDILIHYDDLYFAKKRWVNASSLKDTQKDMTISKDELERYIKFRKDSRSWIPKYLAKGGKGFDYRRDPYRIKTDELADIYARRWS